MKKYLIELKARIIFIFASWLAALVISYFYKETLLFLMLQPDRSIVTSENNPFYFIFTNVTEVFSVYIKLIFWLSGQIMLIQLLYHIFTFLSFALFRLEYNFFKKLLQILLTVFLISAVIYSYLLVPLTWEFFLSFQRLTSGNFISFNFEAKLSEYLNFYVSLYYTCIINFQLFAIFMFFFSYVNSSTSIIKRFRKLYYYIFVIFSTLVSPPDVISQVLISLLLILTYELLIFGFIFKNLLIRQPVEAY